MRQPQMRNQKNAVPTTLPVNSPPSLPAPAAASSVYGHQLGRYAISPPEEDAIQRKEEPDGHSSLSVLDKVQMGLTGLGMVPGVGEFANAASGLVSVAQGDWAGAGLSLAAMVPVAGEAADVAKEARLAGKVIHGGEEVVHAVQGGEKAVHAVQAGEHVAHDATAAAEHALTGAEAHAKPGGGGSGGDHSGGGGSGGGGEHSGGGPERGNEAHNVAQHEEFKRELRRDMEKPPATDPQLQRAMNDNYRPNAKVGSGSTADAIRHETATGQQVGGRSHTLKGTEQIKRLEKWLENNPTASPGDRAAAENVIKDIRDALGH